MKHLRFGLFALAVALAFGGACVTARQFTTGTHALTGTASAGCGITPPSTGNHQLTITVGGATRSYYWQVPTAYDKNTPQRLAFGWHGRGGTGQAMYGKNVWYILDGLAAYPDAVTQAYCQGQACWDQKTDGADMAFYDALLSWIETNYCVDTGRVVHYGYSAGAIWSNVIACVRRESTAAFEAVEGLMPNNTTATNSSNVNPDGGCGGPVPFAAHYNDDDPNIPRDGAVSTRDYWLSAGGCTGDASTPCNPDGGPTFCTLYSGCTTPTGTMRWSEQLDGGGHTWVAPATSIEVAGWLKQF